VVTNKPKQNKKRFFYPPEFEHMRDFLNKNGKFTADLMIQTGARINECRGLQQSPVFDSANGRHNITLIHTKVRAKLKEKVPQARTIPINKNYFYKLKRDILTHRILSTNAFNLQLKEACEKAGIPNPEQFSSHNIRKTFATWILSLGIPPSKVAQHLGHTEKVLFSDYATNDVFSHKDKMMMRSLWGDLPSRLLPDMRYIR